jgi:hypothetical protein
MTHRNEPIARNQIDPLTDARNHQASSLIWWVRNWSPDDDLHRVARFIKQAESDEPLDRSTVRHIAMALRELFCHRDLDSSLRAVAKKLGVTRSQGKRSMTVEEAQPNVAAVFEMLYAETALVAQGIAPSIAKARALRTVAQEQKVSTRTAQAWRRRWGGLVKMIIREQERFVEEERTRNPG